MSEAMRGCLSLTSSGFAFSSHDIGGFEVNQHQPSATLLFSYSLTQGTPPSGCVPSVGCFWTFLDTFTFAWIRLVPRSVDIRRRRGRELGEVLEDETQADAVLVLLCELCVFDGIPTYR